MSIRPETPYSSLGKAIGVDFQSRLASLREDGIAGMELFVMRNEQRNWGSYRSTCCARVILGLAIVSALGASAALGPDWEECNCEDTCSSDAGSTLNTSMGVYSMPSQPLNSISGCLGSNGDSDDFEDIYLIWISYPDIFEISTNPAKGGSADFDSKILVFDSAGNAILGSDDFEKGETYSQVNSQPTQLCEVDVSITEPGLYFVAITSSGRNSTVDVDGTQVPGFPSPGGTGIFCATTSGLVTPIGGWEGQGEQGGYVLACEGLSGIPTCLTDCPADFSNPPDGRVDGDDLAYLLANWNTATCVDLAGGPVLNSEDLGIFLASWGGCGG